MSTILNKPLILLTIFVLLIAPVTPILAVEPYKMLVPFTTDKPIDFPGTTAPIADYIKMIYTYALSIVGILSTIVMMFAGFLWMTGGGNASRVQDAQAWIASALTGLVLALFSYTFLYLINPALVTFKPEKIKNIGNTSICCDPNKGQVPPESKVTDSEILYSCPKTNGMQTCTGGKTCQKTGKTANLWSCDNQDYSNPYINNRTCPSNKTYSRNLVNDPVLRCNEYCYPRLQSSNSYWMNDQYCCLCNDE